MAVKKGRPKKPPKQRVKINNLLLYVEQLPENNPVKQHLTEDKMIRLKRYVEELLYLEFIIFNLKSDIEANGEIEVYKNGSQETRRTNPALTTYIDTVKTYNQLLRQVTELLRNTELDIAKTW